MRTYFYRLVALVLVPALVLADPSLASGFAHFGTQGATIHPSSVEVPFTAQAVVPKLEEAFPAGNEVAFETRREAAGLSRRRFLVGAAATLVLVPSIVAQETKPTLVFPSDVPLPSAPETLRDLKGIANAASDVNFWHQGVTIPDGDEVDDFIPAIIDNSSELASHFGKTTSSIATWFAAGSPLKIINYGSDVNRAFRVDIEGPVIADIEDMVFHSRFENLNSFSRFESATPAPPNEHFLHRFIRKGKDLITRGGISETPRVTIEKNYRRLGMASTQIRINFKNEEDITRQVVGTFQSNLYALMEKDLGIRSKQLEIRFAEKELAHLRSQPENNTDAGRQQADQAEQQIKVLDLDLNRLYEERGNLDDALRRQLINKPEEIKNQGGLHPRRPTFQLDRKTLEILANLSLPDSPGLQDKATLPTYNDVNDSLKHLLSLKGYPHTDIPDILSPEFLSIGLDELWKVPRYKKPLLDKPVPQNPRRSIDVEKLIQLLPEDESVFGKQLADGTWDKDAQSIPEIASDLFQWQIMQEANDLHQKDEESTFASGWRFDLSKLLPIRYELNGARVVDDTKIEMELLSNKNLQQNMPELIKLYRKNVLLKELQSHRREQIRRLSDIRTHALNLVLQYNKLDRRLKLFKHTRRDQPLAIVDLQTPYQEIALGLENLSREILGLQGVLDEADLLFPAGAWKTGAALAAHFARSMAAAGASLQTAPEEMAAPSPSDSKKSKKHDKHLNHSFGMFGLGLSHFQLPHLHYWINPWLPALTPWLQGLTALVIAGVMLLWASFRNEPGEKTSWKSYWPAHLVGAVVLALACPGPHWLGALVAGSVLTIARLTLPHSRNKMGSLGYGLIHWQRDKTRVNKLMGLALIWLLATMLWIGYPPAARLAERQLHPFGQEGSQTLRVNSQIMTQPLLIGAPKGDTGTAEINPALIKQNTFQAGQWIATWKGQRDPELAERFNRINEKLGSFKFSQENRVGNLEQLDTSSPQSRYQRSLVRITSHGEPGSKEARMELLASEMEATIPLYETARDETEVNNSEAGVSGHPSGKLESDHIELERLANAATAILHQRLWRDTRAKGDFEMIPDINRLSSGNTVSSDKPLLIGTQWLKDYARFTYPFSPAEAATAEEFLHKPNSVGVLEDEISGDNVYFRVGDVLGIQDSSNKGLLSEFYKDPASGVIPEFAQDWYVHLPNNQQLPMGTRDYNQKGFFGAQALDHGKLTNRSEKYRIESPTILPGRHVAEAEILPDGGTYEGFEGPQADLAIEAAAYRTAIAKYENLAKRKLAEFNDNSTSRTGAVFAREAKDTYEKALQRAAQFRSALHGVEDEQASWYFSGLHTAHNPAAHASVPPAGAKAYFVNPAAAKTNPFEYHAPTPYQGENARYDPRAIYYVGKTAKMRLVVHASAYPELSVKPGQMLMVSIPGSSREYPATFLETQDFQERQMQAVKIAIIVRLPAENLSDFYPQLKNGGEPIGKVIVIVRKVTTGTTSTPISSVVPNRVPPQPNANPETQVAVAQAATITPSKIAKHSWRKSSSLRVTGVFGFILIHPIELFAQALQHPPVHTGHPLFVWLFLSPILPIAMYFFGNRMGRWWRTKKQSNVPPTPEKKHAKGVGPRTLNDALMEAQKLMRAESPSQKLFGSRHISDATLKGNYTGHDLSYGWESLDQKDTVARAIWNALNSITNDELLKRMANALGVPSEIEKQRDSTNLRLSVFEVLKARFDQAPIFRVNIQPGDPLIDTVVDDERKTVTVVDGPLLHQLVEQEGHQNLESRRTAENALLLLFFRSLAAPERLAGNDAIFSLDQTAASDFLALMDDLLKQLDIHKSLTSLIADFREGNLKNANGYALHVSKEPALGQWRMKKLLDYWQNKPLQDERTDANSKPLSLADQLVHDYIAKDVFSPLAQKLARYYSIKTVSRDWSNARTSFAFIMLISLTGLLSAWFVWPALIPALFRRLTLSQMTWAVFVSGTKEAGVPNLALTVFVGFLIASFFLGAFKATSEFISANWYHWRLLKFYFQNGRANKYLNEFYRLTGEEAFQAIERIQNTSPLLENGEEEGEFRTLFERHAGTINSRIWRSLMKREFQDPRIFTLKRWVVTALYDYERNPLHPDIPFFNGYDFPTLNLPTDAEIFKDLRPKIALQSTEWNGLFEIANDDILQTLMKDLGRSTLSEEEIPHLDAETQWEMILSLRRQDFLQDDDRRKEMEHRKVELAMDVLQDDRYAVPIYLALMSRNLLGLAFDPETTYAENRDDTELLLDVTNASVGRMSRLAPRLYDSYRKYARIASQGFTMHYAVQDLQKAYPEHAGDIQEAFSQVISERGADLTDPRAEPGLIDKQAGADAWVNQCLARMRMERWAPGLANRVRSHSNLVRLMQSFKRWRNWQRLEKKSPAVALFYKRHMGLVRLVKDPTDALALNLMLTPADPKDAPFEERPFLNKTVDVLDNIFKFRLYKKTLGDVDGIVESPDFEVLRKLSEQNHVDVKSRVTAYLKSNRPDVRRRILLELLDQIHLTEGLRNGFIFQQTRRLLKSEPVAFEKYSRRLTGIANLENPTLYPAYLLDRYLQDKDLQPTTEFAGLLMVEDVAGEIKRSLINHTSPDGPKFLGEREHVQEAALDINPREALVEMQEDAMSTDGNIYRVAVSRSLRSFIDTIINRISSRMMNGAARRLHPVLLDQVLHRLHKLPLLGRIILVSPETLTQQKIVDDPAVRGDLIGVPNPFLANAFELFGWLSPLLDQERHAYFEQVEKDFSRKAVTDTLDDIEYLHFLTRSIGVEIRFIAQRFRMVNGNKIDALEDIRPPKGFVTGWVMSDAGAHQRSEQSLETPPVKSDGSRWFSRLINVTHWFWKQSHAEEARRLRDAA